MKKSVFLLLVLIMLFAVLFLSCKNQGNTPGLKKQSEDALEFTLLDDGTYEVKAKKNADLPKNLIIPASHEGEAVTVISDMAFCYCDGMKNVTIPNSVTKIGRLAFDGCSGLTDIIIPNSVTSIGDHVFSANSSLTRIEVAEGNTVYHSSGNCIIETESKTLIAGCKNSVIPDDGSVTSIGGSAFSSCSMTDIIIPDSVTSIGSGAFYSCLSLTSVTIPDGVTSIGDEAFCSCLGLTSVTIGKSVTSIGERAFQSCVKLTSVTIGNGVSSIGSNAFQSCPLSDITYNGTKAQWNAISKEDRWDGNTPNYYMVHCTDGDIPKN